MAEIILIHLTNRCNNNCRICSDKGWLENVKTLSLDEIEEKLKTLKNRKDVIINVYGGEPFFNMDIFEILDYASEMNIRVGIATNGRVLHDESIVRKLKGHNLLIRTSLHSHVREIHEDITRIKGSFDQTVQGIKNLVKHGVQVLVNVVINSKNFNELSETTEFLIGLGIRKIKFSGLIYMGELE